MKFFSNNLLQTLCYLIVRRVTRREGFTINVYIEALLINGAKQIDLENIGSAFNT